MKSSQIDFRRLNIESCRFGIPEGISNHRIRLTVLWGWMVLFFLCGSGARAQLLVGNSYNFSVTFTNAGGPLSVATIMANVPPDIMYVSCNGGITCSVNSGQVFWDIGSVATNQSVSVSYLMTVNSCSANSISF